MRRLLTILPELAAGTTAAVLAAVAAVRYRRVERATRGNLERPYHSITIRRSGRLR